FERGPRCQDSLGEVLRSVVLGRRKAWLGNSGSLLADLGSAFVTESTAGRVDVTTGRARQLKARAATVTEAGASGIVLLATRAAHQASSFNSASACSGKTPCPSRGTSS